jgi:hypothetical protein
VRCACACACACDTILFCVCILFCYVFKYFFNSSPHHVRAAETDPFKSKASKSSLRHAKAAQLLLAPASSLAPRSAVRGLGTCSYVVLARCLCGVEYCSIHLLLYVIYCIYYFIFFRSSLPQHSWRARECLACEGDTNNPNNPNNPNITLITLISLISLTPCVRSR